MFQSHTIFQNPSRLLWLIVASLLLLGLSQVLWLNKVWQEQKYILRQESNYIFQYTVMSLQDSLVRKSMSKKDIRLREKMPMPPQSWRRRTWQPMYPGVRQIITDTLKEPSRDETDMGEKLEKSQVKIIIARTDTHSGLVQRDVSRFLLNYRQDSSAAPGDLVFELQADTISTEVLKQRYILALDKAGLPHSFKLLHFSAQPTIISKSELSTIPAMAGLMHNHFVQAVFQDYKGYLVQKVLPNALFSSFLLSLTTLAFWLIFKTLKQQQKIARQKNEFVSNVTHELKTPLTTVGVALEALSDFEVLQNPEKAKEYLDISKLELDRLNLLVDKVLSVSMFEHQEMQLKPETLDLVATTRQVIHAMTLQAKSVGATINFHADSNPCMVFCDQLHLNGVVYNLLDNALKYRRETPEIEVSIGKAMREGIAFYNLAVRDNGIGISAEHQSQIFEKFFRVPAGDTHNVKGHGLGLSYVAHVVKEHGGCVWVDSVPGTGSRFIVEIPAAAPPPTA